jgi:penicillin amidase
MKHIRKIAVSMAIVLLIIALVLAGVGTWFVRHPWSQVSGTTTVSNLSAPVQIMRDEWGVPHIYAENEHDLFFAQGYVHAQDRLWQMEFNRHIGSGSLSAILGSVTQDADRFMRTLGLRRAAEREWATLDGDTRLILEAYAQGVNAYLDTHRDQLPLEFTLLGVTPEPWAPIDTLVWGKLMSLNLGGNFGVELLRAQIVAEYGEETAQQLLPPFAHGTPLVIPSEAHQYTWLRDTQLEKPNTLIALLGYPSPDWGSNNWVVDGSRTTTGKPILANDTHMGLSMPSIWYENGLHGGRFDIVGFSFPGVPLVVIGHNAHIAWGVSNLPADVQDLYIEKLDDPVQPTQYEFEGEWHDLQVIQETIEIKGQAPVELNVLLTQHGPIMNDVLDNDMKEVEPMALSWTSLDGPGIFSAIKGINLATNWEEFRQALRSLDAPAQNFVYADINGNFGYQATGKIPIRTSDHQGLVPVPGWTGEYEWQGFIPFEQLPSLFNPDPGFIATANNKVIPDDYLYQLTYEWAPPYRIQRITDMLMADPHLDLEDTQTIQADTYELPASALRPYLLAVEPENELQATALAQVAAWDLYHETDRVGALIYQVWYWFLAQNTLNDQLDDNLMNQYLVQPYFHVPFMVDLMTQVNNPWFDDMTTPTVENRDDIVRRSLFDTVVWLSERYGDAPEQWTWGRLHTMTFVHQPFGQSGIAPLERLFNSKPIPARGGGFTVNAAWFSAGNNFQMIGGTAQRFIVDMSDLSNSLAIHTTGQNGNLFHPHREDFIAMWQNLDYHPMFFTRAGVETNAANILTLAP